MNTQLSRRAVVKRTIAAACAVGSTSAFHDLTSMAQGEPTDAHQPWQLRYLLGSCMFGTTELSKIVPIVASTGADALDIWPKPHGNQREQLDVMGENAFVELLTEHKIKLGCITQYGLGPFGLQKEMQIAQRLGCHTMVTGGNGPGGATGNELKSAVSTFVEKMKPHLAVAEQAGVTIAIENHGHNLINTPDSMKWLMELCPSESLGIAFAPYHLPQDARLISQLIRDLGDRIAVFYAWQHGMGCMKKLPKEQELLQMPGRGELDFGPILNALAEIEYCGWTQIFMHPVPRGIPILEPTSAVVREINRSRRYLENHIANRSTNASKRTIPNDQ